jgi:hypothetical protein
MVAFPSSGSGHRRVVGDQATINIKLEAVKLEMCWLETVKV